MNLRIAIVEDVPSEADLLKGFIATYCDERNIEAHVDLFHGSLDFMDRFAQQYDIIFLDIEFAPNEENGMETAHAIRRKDKDCTIVFVTNLGRFAIEGYQVGAIDFILKPIQYEGFKFRFDGIVQKFLNGDGRALLIKSKGDYVKIRSKDIYYVCIINHICYFYGTFNPEDGEDHLSSYEAWMQMSTLEKELSSSLFVRCSPSYLINIAHVNKILKDAVIVGNTTLPLSRNKKKGVITAYMASFGNI